MENLNYSGVTIYPPSPGPSVFRRYGPFDRKTRRLIPEYSATATNSMKNVILALAGGKFWTAFSRFDRFHTGDYRSNIPFRLAKHVSIATWAAFRVGPRRYGIPGTVVGGCWSWKETVVNRQNNCTDVDPSLIGGGRRRFQDDKHTLRAAGSNSGIMRYNTLSVNNLHRS